MLYASCLRSSGCGSQHALSAANGSSSVLIGSRGDSACKDPPTVEATAKSNHQQSGLKTANAQPALADEPRRAQGTGAPHSRSTSACIRKGAVRSQSRLIMLQSEALRYCQCSCFAATSARAAVVRFRGNEGICKIGEALIPEVGWTQDGLWQKQRDDLAARRPRGGRV
jgi:hypothetical protein